MIELIKKITKHSDVALALGLIGILMVLLFPVPKGILDVLLAFSIATSVLILMTTLFIEKPLELSVFPTILLVTTMIRLSLNIASTRLILAEGHQGTDAAGHVIEAFGEFVMQSNVVIGIIVFMILTIINFIVITKGSGRIAEVAARFSLDSMPGKQMAIDADLSAGLIDEETARNRRKTLEDESSFYGAMDGANKFVRGDAIAGLIITFINLVGGIIIGILQRDLSFDQAVQTYSMLTIGDGLVSQIPSLIVSLSAGLLVTKSGSTGSADRALFGQLSKYPKAIWMAATVTGLMSLIPGLPFIPFAILSMLLSFSAYTLGNNQIIEAREAKKNEMLKQQQEQLPQENLLRSLAIDPISIELGYNLLTLVNTTRGPRVTDQIKSLRKQMIKDYGFVIPSIKINDNLQLDQNSYQVKVKEIMAGRGNVFVDKILVMNPSGEEVNLPGEKTKEPTFGLDAKWVDEMHREEASFYNYTVIDPSTVIITHLTEIIRDNITELLSYSETQKLLDEIGDEHKKLVKELVPEKVTVALIQKVLHSLLEEMISIRDLPSILEGIYSAVQYTKNINEIIEAVRLKLSRQISNTLLNSEGFIPAVYLSKDWEQAFNDALVNVGEEQQLSMPPSKVQEFINKFNKVYNEQSAKGYIPVLVTSSKIRPFVKALVSRFRAGIAIISQNEIYNKIQVRTFSLL
jgi:flagellar biosynthesis protein FlhA